METLKKVLLSKQATRFYWQTLGGALGLLIVFLQDPAVAQYWFVAVIIPVIQGITKEINNKHKK